MRSDYLNENSGKTASYKKKVELVSAARTLAEADSGKVFFLESSGGAYSITLPTTSTGIDGVNYKFFVEEETPSNAITLAAGSAIISLVMKDAGGDASNSTVGTQVSNIVIGTSAERADVIDLIFWDGEWYATALSGINNAITTS